MTSRDAASGYSRDVDNLLDEVMQAATTDALPNFLDSVFGFLARRYPSSLARDTGGITLEHLISQSVAKWRRCGGGGGGADHPDDNTLQPHPLPVEEIGSEVTLGSSSSGSHHTSTAAPEELELSEDRSPDRCPRYAWSQTVEEVDITVPVPSDVTRGRQVEVKIESERVSVRLRDSGGDALLSGSLHAAVNCSESIWDLTPAQHVTLHLLKRSCSWWPVARAVVGVACTVEGATVAERQLCSLPQEEQADIQRVMFDAQQKAIGRPTSDTLQAEAMLRDAWTAEGSPFQGQPFDIGAVNLVTQK